MNNRATTLLATSFSAIMLAGALALPASAQENQMTKQPARIAVTGEGTMTASPDMAILNLSVLREAKTAREAMTANNEAMSKVLEAMKRPASRIATSRPGHQYPAALRLSGRQERPEGAEHHRLHRFQQPDGSRTRSGQGRKRTG